MATTRQAATKAEPPAQLQLEDFAFTPNGHAIRPPEGNQRQSCQVINTLAPSSTRFSDFIKKHSEGVVKRWRKDIDLTHEELSEPSDSCTQMMLIGVTSAAVVARQEWKAQTKPAPSQVTAKKAKSTRAETGSHQGNPVGFAPPGTVVATPLLRKKPGETTKDGVSKQMKHTLWYVLPEALFSRYLYTWTGYTFRQNSETASRTVRSKRPEILDHAR